MTVRIPAKTLARTTPARTPRPVPNASRTTPLDRDERGTLTGIEGDAFGASTELVYLRSDLDDAESDQNNRDMEAAIRALDAGDTVLARSLMVRALAVEIEEGAAVERAKERRHRAHSHTRSIAGRVELALTARGREGAIVGASVHPLALCTEECES